MHGVIRGDDILVGDVDVTNQFLNESGEGYESLNTQGRSSGEVDAHASGEGGIGGSNEEEADEGEAGRSGEVHIYINKLILCCLYTYINALSFSPLDRGNLQYGRNEAQPRRFK